MAVYNRRSRKMKRWPFTKPDVDYLVDEQKFVKEIPKSWRKGNYTVMELRVFRRGELAMPIKGLFVTCRVVTPVSGIPRAIPSSVLEWHGYRIRGMDREQQHDNPDGSIVYGWHEHLWSPEYDAALVIGVPEPKHKDLLGLLRTGMKRWNIEVIKDQLEVEDDG
jgi:hypothetical protein